MGAQKNAAGAQVTRRRWGPTLAFLAVVLAIAAGYFWWTRDERAIRSRLSDVGRSLTVAPNEPELARVTRIAALRNALAPDIRVWPPATLAGAPAPPQIVGRDTVLALAARWVPPPGGLGVSFSDVDVRINGDGTTAAVSCTATIATGGASEPPTAEAHALTIGFSHIDGEWVVTSVRPRD
jgi:hypothetical protein